jgi:hypothetical protein
MTICSFTIRDEATMNHHRVEVRVENTKEKMADIILAIADIDSESTSVEAKLEVNLSNIGIAISTQNFSIGSFTACIIGCGVGNLAGAVFDCITNGILTGPDLKKCLMAKGHSIAQELVKCVVACAVTS